MEKSQVPERQRKESEGRVESEKSEVDESDGDTDVEEKLREEEIEREEKVDKGRCEKESSKHEGVSRTERGGGYKGRSRSEREELASEEEVNGEESRNSDRREGRGKGSVSQEWTMERRGDMKTEEEKERCKRASKDGSASKAEWRERRGDGVTGSYRGKDAERKDRVAESEKYNAREMVKRREEKVRRPVERKEFMEIIAEMALDMKVEVKGVVEIKSEGKKELMLVEMEEEEDKKKLFSKRWEIKKRWRVMVDEELTREERYVRWRIEEKKALCLEVMSGYPSRVESQIENAIRMIAYVFESVAGRCKYVPFIQL
ncbi:golgin subfamily A member 6-like protein 1 [Temnothorax curvispinosus]|uniref:Golgin subfamily A member 6-like protein 1 n=1 Tax=Temnothorax curvispinosus TaxID=300111 RepID=A0A6J1QS34_9HYME|nr:golgin subfamily A member 6-like protein 1 [Temnothorax curvispinosus]